MIFRKRLPSLRSRERAFQEGESEGDHVVTRSYYPSVLWSAFRHIESAKITSTLDKPVTVSGIQWRSGVTVNQAVEVVNSLIEAGIVVR